MVAIKILWLTILGGLLTAVAIAQTGVLNTNHAMASKSPAVIDFGLTHFAPPGKWATAFVNSNQPDAPPIDFPLGTATPSEVCGTCHGAIYFENAFGFGADLKFKPIILKALGEPLLSMPANVPDTGTAHYLAGVDPWPIRAREVENGGASCNVCHFPQPFDIPDINTPVIGKPVPRSRDLEAVGITCASCHLTPDGKIRGPYGVPAPHATVQDLKIKTSGMCAFCHSFGPRVVGKQTQTFYEWRDDFYNAGLGQQHCQDCHMPRTVRSLAESYSVPPRVSSRHLWTGDHSLARISQGLNLTIVSLDQTQPASSTLQFHVINIAAGHSVPTGSNRRAVYLKAQVTNSAGAVLATNEWMFAPWYGNRPDDRAFLEADKSLPDAIAAMQADAQGPHEAQIRAGEDRILSWAPQLASGTYTITATLTYDLNRYNDRAFTDDQTEIARNSRTFVVQSGIMTPTPTPTPTATPTPTPASTPAPMQLLLEESAPVLNQAVALDSIFFLRDPFPVMNGADLFNLGVDRNTRVILFVTNLQLLPGETSSSVIVNLVDSKNQSYDVSAEDVRPVPNFNFVQVIFRLPDSLAVGTCTTTMKVHGQVSNAGTIRIRN